MGNMIDLTGKRFNRLTVLERDFSKGGKGRIFWKCRCDCGTEKVAAGGHLKNGHTKSCGCLNQENRERHVQSHTKHNLRHTKLYSVWAAIRARCNNPSNKSYSYYGGKGVSVCDEWQGDNGFQSFYDWAMSNGYDADLTIDRIDTNGDYCPENCRWVDMKAQSNNRSNNIYIVYNGEKKTLTQHCEDLGLNYRLMRHRMFDLDIPFEIAMNMDGFQRVEFRGKPTDMRHIAKDFGIRYKDLLRCVLVEGKDIEQSINELRGI